MAPVKKIYFFFITGLLLSACYTPRYIYSPPASNVPVLTKKGDSKLAAFYSSSPFSNTSSKNFYNYGFDIQAAFALSKHWALIVNKTNRYEKNSGDFDYSLSDSAVIRYKRGLTEFGGGYYTMLSHGNKMIFQLIGGMGMGKFTLDDNGKNSSSQSYSRYHETKVTKVFLQPAIQISYNKYFNTSFASRFTLLWYYGIKTNYTPEEQQAFLLNELNGSPKTFWEPVVINSFILKKLPAYRFELQFGFASLVSHRFVDYRSVNVSIGAMVDFSRMKKGHK